MHKFSLETPVEEMDEGDLRSTLDEFMEKHEENVADYESVATERDEFSEKVETLEADAAEFAEVEEALTAKFAEVVAQESSLFDTEEVAERFSLDELIVKADTLGAFTLAADGQETPEDGAEDEGEGSTFANKPDRAPTGSGSSGGSGSKFSEEAREDLNMILGLQ
jgi:predicted nuclease with TOPRIM domain